MSDSSDVKSFGGVDDLKNMEIIIREHLHGKDIPDERITFSIFSDEIVLYLPIKGLAAFKVVTSAVFKSGYSKYLKYRTHPHSMQYYSGKRKIGSEYKFSSVKEFKELLGQHYLLNEKIPPAQLRLQFKLAENKIEKLLKIISDTKRQKTTPSTI